MADSRLIPNQARERAAEIRAGAGDLTVRETARLLELPEATVRKEIAVGRLAAVPRGPGFLIERDALADWLDRAGAPGDSGLTTIDVVTIAGGVEPRTPRRRARPGALPASLTPFIGREREVAAVGALLRRDGVRLVTLTGAGGGGKTRLALRVAEQLTPFFADGAVLVSLATVRDAERAPAAILTTLGGGDGSDDDPLGQLIALLEDQELLVVLDNLEQIPEAGDAVVDILANCPGVKILVTSRIPLRVSGEHLFPVQSMTAPRLPETTGADANVDVNQLLDYEAIRLFLDRARAADPDFDLTAANAATIAAICARVEGLPLAIELAAARAAALTPTTLLSRLERRLPLLTDGPRDQPDRLRTMRGAIAWSWDLLAPPRQRLLRRLSVFVGGVSLTGAEAVADLTLPPGEMSNERDAALGSLAALVESGLLQRAEDPFGEARFTMLETVREFGQEQLEATGEEFATRRAHAAASLAFVRVVQDALWTSPNEALYLRIEQEHDNARAALAWAVEHEPETALWLAAGLAPFRTKRSYWTEARASLEQALAASSEPTLARSAALGRLGAVLTDQGDFPPAQAYYAEALAIAEPLGDLAHIARIHRGMGIIASNTSDFAAATTLFGQALEEFRALNDRAGIARGLNDLGLVAERQGDHPRAIALQEEALPLARELGDDWMVGIILGNLGGAYLDGGDTERGMLLTEEALEYARRLDDTFGVAVNLFNLADGSLRQKDASRTAALLLESLLLARQVDELHLASRAVDRIGASLVLDQQYRAAARLFGAATGVRDHIGDTLFAEERANLAEWYEQTRDKLGEQMFTAAWETGHALPPAVAISEAIKLAGSIRPAEPVAGTAAAVAAPTASPAEYGLTEREIEVLRLLADGKSDKDIASELFISRPTASKHVAAITAKLEVDSRTAAVARAFRLGLV